MREGRQCETDARRGGSMGNKKQTIRRTLVILLLTLPVAFVYNACSRYQSAGGINQSSGASTSNLNYLTGKMQMSLVNASGNLIYSDAAAGGSLTFKANTNYGLNLNVTGYPANTQYSLEMTQTDVVNGTTVTVPLTAGLNSFTVPTQGDYSWKLMASAPGYQSQTKFYLANVTCQNPTFTQSSLDPAALTVSQGSGTNLYNFSAANVVANANGMGPYECAFDPTGTGIVDTSWQNCTQAFNNFYVNYVSTRNVGVIVKDACNTTYAVSAPVQLTYTEPTMPGNVFIFGQISNATGTAKGDSRVDNVTYLATNSGGNDIVQPHYSSGSFQITSSQNYGMPSSSSFGVQINVKGIQDSLNVSTMTGTVNASNAYISSLSYTTDEAGDAKPPLDFNSTNCTLSNQGAKVLFTAGTPCSSGTAGDQNKATVEVWGHYQCTISDVSGGAQITGDFDGYTHLVDNCSGGGGGGGGIVPIQL